MIEALPIFAQTAAAAQPSERSLHHPAFRQHDESLDLIGTLDDLHRHIGQHGFDGAAEFGSLIATIGLQLEQKRVETE